MKKIFLFCMMALVAMCGLNSCSDDCNHEFIEHDFTQDIVGTWTFLNGEQAEAMVIKADGSFTTTGIMKGGALYEEKGTIKVVNNKVTLAFDGDTDEFEGRLEFVAGKSMSIVMFDDNDVRLTYDYCENDLSDEIIGMWVCNDGWTNDIAIQTYTNDGKSTMTTATSIDTKDPIVNKESDYIVVGDMLFRKIPAADGAGYSKYIIARMVYTPNGTAFGDIMTHIVYIPSENGVIESVDTFLRVKQNLNLAGKAYAYSSAYVTNAKGADEDFSMFGRTFNMANINAANFDMAFGADLFCVVLNANSMTQKFRPDDLNLEVVTPITVEGNKVTLDYSAENPACRKVEMYMFQDADDSQLHIYMPTSSFIDYIANMVIREMLAVGKIDPTDAAAIEKVYADMEARVESINVSFVLKALK